MCWEGRHPPAGWRPQCRCTTPTPHQLPKPSLPQFPCAVYQPLYPKLPVLCAIQSALGRPMGEGQRRHSGADGVAGTPSPKTAKTCDK